MARPTTPARGGMPDDSWGRVLLPDHLGFVKRAADAVARAHEQGRRVGVRVERGRAVGPLAKMIRRAGLDVWPKPVQNLRASCETGLVQDHPIHVVCAWVGNTPEVALEHYLQVLDGDFAKALAGPPALQNALRSPAGGGRRWERWETA